MTDASRLSSPLFLAVLAMLGVGCGRPDGAEADRLAPQAGALLAEQQWDAARILLNRAVALRPTFAEAWVGLGMAEAETGNVQAARTAYGEALALYEQRYLKTHDPNPLFQQLLVLRLLGEHEEMARRLHAGKAAHPGDAELDDAADVLDEQEIVGAL